MRRRHSVKSKLDPQRRKSTSSVHSVHLEHIDPELAQRDAQIAACQAYARAQDRAAVDMPLFPPTPDSSPRRRQAERESSGQDDVNQDLQRRQSVRFVGPFSVQGKTGSAGETSTNRNSRGTVEELAQLQEYDTSTSSHSSVLRLEEDFPAPVQLPRVPPPRPNRGPPLLPLPGIAAGYLDVLAAGEEYYTPEDDIASAPSSFRRLRRSRSMFTSEGDPARKGQDISVVCTNGNASGPQQPPDLNNKRMLYSDHQGAATLPPTPLLRAPKSMSFLRSRSILASSRTSRDSDCRDLLPHDIHGTGQTRNLATVQSTPQLGSRPTGLFGSRNRRTETPMRKSLRSGSTTDYAESPGLGSPPGKDDGFKIKAKKASRSFKTKLKSFFTLSRSEEAPPTIPIQHIESRRHHISENVDPSLSSGLEQPSSTGWGSFHRVASRLPSVQSVPANVLHSTHGSVESLKSERERKVSDDKSLTSWAHSGPSTLTSQQQQQWKEWETQRLSVIRENGTHAPSPSMRRPALGSQVFQNPNTAAREPGQTTFTADSQRIYSALMKRVQAIGEKHTRIIEQRQRSFSFEDPGTDNTTPLGRADSGSVRSPPDAMMIGSFDQNTSLPPEHTLTPTRPSRRLCTPDVGSDREGQTGESPPAELDRQWVQEESARKGDQAPQGAEGVDLLGLEPEAKINTRVPSPDPFVCHTTNQATRGEELKAFTDRGSAFFGSPSSHLFRTTSPYRRHLRKSMEEEQPVADQESQGSQNETLESGTELHVAPPDLGSEFPDEEEYSESVYSTDEHHGAVDQGKAPLGRDANEGADGPLTYKPASCRVNSSDSSVDWKAWLSANVAKLESSPQRSKPDEIEYALPTMPKSFSGGHVRERAQRFEEYDEEFKAPEPPTRRPTLPNSPLSTVEPNVVKLLPQQRSVKRTTPPSSRTPLPENDMPSSVPPIPPKSVRRVAPPSLRRAGSGIGCSAAPSVSSSPGLSAAVQRQFGPVSKNRCLLPTYPSEGSELESSAYRDCENQGIDSDGPGAFI